MQMSTSTSLLRSQKVVALDLLEDGPVVCLVVSGKARSHISLYLHLSLGGGIPETVWDTLAHFYST